AASAVLACCPIAGASDIDWINSFGGSFEDPKNWSFAFVPRTFDLIRFGYRAGPYTVVIDNLATVEAFGMYGGEARTSLQGRTLSMSRGDPLLGPGMRVADGAGETAALTLLGGGRFAG